MTSSRIRIQTAVLGFVLLPATVGVLAVHAVGGWWKNNRRKDRIDLPVRYALIVSLRTRAEDVDIYTPIAAALSIPTEAVAIEI